jgi:hypothetical protein
MAPPEAPPAGPLDAAVFDCPGCGCLVVDTAVHEPVCPGNTAPGTIAAPLGPQIVDWLDTLDPEELERQALEAEGFDTNGTVAVLKHLKQLAAGL